MRTVIAIFIALTSVVIIDWAEAQEDGPVYNIPRCAPHDQMVAELEGEKYEEVQQGWGLMVGGHAVKDGVAQLAELYVQKGGSWTIIATPPGGETCIVAYGLDWVWTRERGKGV